MRRGPFIGLLLAILPVLSGCGTFVNVRDDRDDGKPSRTPYGGVQYDACCGSLLLSTVVRIPDSEGPWEFLPPGQCFVWGTYVLLVDLPFTAITDTLTLPYVLLAGPGTISKSGAQPATGETH